ncbi:glycosyltransferase family 2 protein [Tropicimonas isoalkanivorans]|nr:glycosyltransferase family 2 protein [Tropicimonas isoalkanivorans]
MLKRHGYQLRAWRRGRDLTPVTNRTQAIRPQDVLAFTTLRNERVRLPYFLDYYRAQGIGHFLMVDNASDDGSRDYLAEQPDVSLWTTPASYRGARFGVDWLNRLQHRYGHGHWTLVVDADEFFVYPYCDTRPIQALTGWLETCGMRSFSAMLIDMYPRGPVDAEPYSEGQNPFEIASWFDNGNYFISRNPEFHNLWIQGGPRARVFFPDKPGAAPSLNKIPLVKWRRDYVYLQSTHMLLPRALNVTYDDQGGEMTSGALLHAKFLSTLARKAAGDVQRKAYSGQGRENRANDTQLRNRPVLWTRWSEKYINWRQLEILGLMSKGNWA